MAQRQGHVGHFLVAPPLGIGLIFLPAVAVTAEIEQFIVARMSLLPTYELTGLKIILIVLSQLPQGGTGHVEKLQFQLHRCHAVSHSLHDVLLTRTGGLYHLVYRTVAVFGQESFGEDISQLIESHCLLIEPQLFPVGLFSQDSINHRSRLGRILLVRIVCHSSYFFRRGYFC